MLFDNSYRNRCAAFCSIGLLLFAARSAPASTVSYHLTGRVSRVTGAATSGLKALGVEKDAVVTIDWIVELTTPVHSDNPPTHTTEYWATTPANGIAAFTIQIGSWTATGQDPTAQNSIAVNRIIVGDGPPTDPMDPMDLSRSATDTGHLVSDDDPTAEMGLDLFAPSGGGSTSTALGDQTPSQYLESTGFVTGSGGEVDFSVPGINGLDPTAKCRAAQLASAGTLCQSTLKCLAAHAKALAKDPLDVKLDNCLGKARDKFVVAFDKDAATAAKNGVSCGTSEDGAAFAADFDEAEAVVVGVVDTVNPQTPAVISSWYSGAASMCSTAARAESKDIAKPSGGKVAMLRETARLKLTAAATKVVASAEKKGVIFDPEPDVAGLVSSIDRLVDELVDEIDGLN